MSHQNGYFHSKDGRMKRPCDPLAVWLTNWHKSVTLPSWPSRESFQGVPATAFPASPPVCCFLLPFCFWDPWESAAGKPTRRTLETLQTHRQLHCQLRSPPQHQRHCLPRRQPPHQLRRLPRRQYLHLRRVLSPLLRLPPHQRRLPRPPRHQSQPSRQRPHLHRDPLPQDAGKDRWKSILPRWKNCRRSNI